jgi:hypothetical protein
MSNSNYDSNYDSNEERQWRLEAYEKGMKEKPIGYPFHSLKDDINIFKKRVHEFKDNTAIESEFANILEFHCFKARMIDENTYDYMLKLHELKHKMMYPTFIDNDTRFIKKLKLQDLIELVQQLSRILNKKVDDLWVYYGDKETNLIDITVLIYLEYLNPTIPKGIQKYTNHNKKVLEEFIHFLLEEGVKPDHLYKYIDNRFLHKDKLYRMLYKGLFNKSRRNKSLPLVTLNNYRNRHRSIKKLLEKVTNRRVISNTLTRKKIPKYLHTKIKNYIS